MKILILNWRDIQNPKGGGAEILTHEMAKRWVKLGHEVTQFSERFNHSKTEEVIDGVRIVRGGTAQVLSFGIPVHLVAFFWYLVQKNQFEIIIDEIHGLPFFTPLYVKVKKIVLICEVADKLWMSIYGRFFGTIGRLVELFYLRIPYRKIHFLTISNSTQEELIKNGVDKSLIHVIPMGISQPPFKSLPPKEKKPTLIFVGRVSKSKGIEDAILAVQKLIQTNSDVNLWIVGRGDHEYTLYLKDISKKRGVWDNVKFYGFISEKEKFNLMARSHILISPSIKEGFGLTIAEAGFVGTPSVVYNSPGLSEVVEDKKTGLVCNKNTPSGLAECILTLLEDKSLYEKLRIASQEKSTRYDWNKTADFVMEIMKKL